MTLEAVFIPTPDTNEGNALLPIDTPPQPATKQQWKPKPVSLNIPAYTKPVKIQLEGVPLVPGVLVCTGVKCTGFNGVVWYQPWKLHTHTVGADTAIIKQLQMVGWSKTGGAKSGSAGGEGFARIYKGTGVRVLPALPKATLKLVSVTNENAERATRNCDAEQVRKPPTIEILQGQILTGLAIEVINTSNTLPIKTLRWKNTMGSTTSTSTPGNAQASCRKAPFPIDDMIKVCIDDIGAEKVLKEALPLLPGQSLKLPLIVSAAMTASTASSSRVGTAHSSYQYLMDMTMSSKSISVEYSGTDDVKSQEEDSSTGTSRDHSTIPKTVLGRRAMLNIPVTVSPSVQPTRVECRQLAMKSDNGTLETVILVEVVNKSNSRLSSWMVNKGIDDDVDAIVRKKDGVELAPGQRGVLTLRIAPLSHLPHPATDTNAVSGGRGLRPLRYEDKERELVASALAASVGIICRAQESATAACTVLLHGGDIFNALGNSTFGILAALREPAAVACLSVTHADNDKDVESVHQVSYQLAGLLSEEASFYLPALPARSGQLLRVSLVLENLSSRPLEVVCALSFLPLPATRDNDGSWNVHDAIVNGSYALPSGIQLNTTSNGMVEWTGVIGRLKIALPAHASVHHIAGLTISVPGVYRLGLSQVEVVGLVDAGERHGDVRGDGMNTLVRVQPCFVTVT